LGAPATLDHLAERQRQSKFSQIDAAMAPPAPPEGAGSSPAATHAALELDLCADVAEWCPLPGRRRLLAAGTYQLDEATQRRAGRLHLFRLRGDLDAERPALALAPAAAPLDLPGVFDLRWRPAEAGAARGAQLAAALADGGVRLLEARGGGDETLEIGELAAEGAAPGAPMALSLDYDAAGGALAASFSDGGLRLLRAGPAALEATAAWRAHDLEAWVAAYDRHDGNVIYSGGDDGALKCWDARAGGRAPAWVDRRAHGAGVCCVAGAPLRPHLLASGSYDDAARLWDARRPGRPLLAAAAPAGGGVWRLKWHPTDPALLLAACMQGGFALLRADVGGDEGSAGGAGAEGGGAGCAIAATLEVAERYVHQQTLAYGAGWCAEVGARGASVAATASFYDRLLHVWTPATRAAGGGGGGGGGGAAG
jgi:diphthamide biosynthesis protein 7